MAPSILVLSKYEKAVSTRPEAEAFMGLARAGVAVTIMTRPGSPHAERFREAGIRVLDGLPDRRRSASAIRRIRTELRAGGYQVVFACDGTSVYSAVWAAMGLPVKLVVYRGYVGNVHWYDPTAYLKMLHPRIDAYWCNSEAVRDDLRRNLLAGKDRPVAIDKCHDVRWYDGVAPADRASLGLPPGAFAVLLAAAFRPMKGVPVILEATRHLPPERSDVHLVFAGPGMDDPETRRLVAESPMRERIHVLGPRKDVLPLMAACDAFALPSIKGESFTKALVEAMCMGMPSVVTDLPGNVGMVVDGVCGRVVPTGDPRAFAAGLADLASDRERARRWGTAARERMDRCFPPQRTVDGLRALVERLARA
jgi:glycosyltransferase involved in cell wall biosynthesis